jgi:hypothetical protein
MPGSLRVYIDWEIPLTLGWGVHPHCLVHTAVQRAGMLWPCRDRRVVLRGWRRQGTIASPSGLHTRPGDPELVDGAAAAPAAAGLSPSLAGGFFCFLPNLCTGVGAPSRREALPCICMPCVLMEQTAALEGAVSSGDSPDCSCHILRASVQRSSACSFAAG